MGYYDRCRPDQRFTSVVSRAVSTYGTAGSLWVIFDWDQRRTISVGTLWPEQDEDFIFEALALHTPSKYLTSTWPAHLGDMEGDTSTRAGDIFYYDEDRNDIKYTISTLYEIITRDMHFREENYPHELDLDAPVEEYRHVLLKWVKLMEEVNGKITHWGQAKSPIEWPPLREFDPMIWRGAIERTESSMRCEMKPRGLGHLYWQRPGSCELSVLTSDGGTQSLLATGEVVDESGDVVDIGTQILSVDRESKDDASNIGNGSVDEDLTEEDGVPFV
ncbi:hypothetical protein VP1G_10563 [Cytospora mali]|uniref:Uncharacterized protein n=1 Tax=Cytospora mali TaxID=578113 RepID=A0A194UPU4_CYTMA|nr:hypothetical protein VP1G_10563 [Valsa mali var. pyri (nom. inval.)]